MSKLRPIYERERRQVVDMSSKAGRLLVRVCLGYVSVGTHRAVFIELGKPPGFCSSCDAHASEFITQCLCSARVALCLSWWWGVKERVKLGQ